jgi:NADH-quinone oxidoreductase subunit H
VGSLGVYGVALGGFASNNKFSFLGGLRATAQMLSYEIPLGLSLLSILIVIGTIVPDQIIRRQAADGWLIFHQPLAAIIFFIAGLAEANRAPFDNAEAEQELVGGYHTEYSAMRFALFFLAEYAHMVTASAFFAVLFLGGYQLLPFVHDPLTSPDAVGLLAVLVKFLVLFGKVITLIAFMMLIRWTIPRLRFDQIMQTAWQAVIPLALCHVIVVSFLVYFNFTGLVPMLLANIAVAVGFTLVQPLLPRSESNRRVPLYGSRFNPMPGERVSTSPTLAMAVEDRPVEGSLVKMS